MGLKDREYQLLLAEVRRALDPHPLDARHIAFSVIAMLHDDDPLDPRLTFVSSGSGGQLVGSEVVFTAAGTPEHSSTTSNSRAAAITRSRKRSGVGATAGVPCGVVTPVSLATSALTTARSFSGSSSG